MYVITDGEHTYRVARLDAEAGVVKPGGYYTEGDFVPGIHWKYNYRNDNETEDIIWNTVYSGPCKVETLP